MKHCATLTILVALLLASFDTSAARETKPNVLFIAVDDLRDTLRCYGSAAVRTPNIHRLASRGVVFERAYVQYPVCNASRSSFLTGLYHLGERNWWNKNTLFDRSCRAPLIVAGPGITPGRAPGLVEFVDLFPTIAEHCEVAVPAGRAGTSLWPQLKDTARPGRSSAGTIVTRGRDQRGDSIRTDRWRLAQWSDGAIELYNQTSGPQETRNVATGYSGVVEERREEINRRRSETRKRTQIVTPQFVACPPWE